MPHVPAPLVACSLSVSGISLDADECVKRFAGHCLDADIRRFNEKSGNEIGLTGLLTHTNWTGMAGPTKAWIAGSTSESTTTVRIVEAAGSLRKSVKDQTLKAYRAARF